MGGPRALTDNPGHSAPPTVIVRHAFTPPDNERLAHLCGALDEHLRAIEVGLNVTIARRHEAFRIEGGRHPAMAWVQRGMSLGVFGGGATGVIPTAAGMGGAGE